MPLDYEAGGDVSNSGGFLSESGTFHILVVDATETPTKKDGTLMDNAVFGVTLEVLGGTNASQVTKQTKQTFRHGKLGEEKSLAFAKKKMDRMFLATGLLTRQQIENKERVSINVTDMIGRQLVAKFDRDAPDGYLDIWFTDIYHVDDPAVKDIPKNVDALKLIPASLRWTGEQAAAATAKASPAAGGSSNGKSKAASKSAAAPAASTPAPVAPPSAGSVPTSVYDQV